MILHILACALSVGLGVMMMLVWNYMFTRQNAFNFHLMKCREYSVRSQEAFQAGNRELAEFLLVRAREELDLCSQYVDPL